MNDQADAFKPARAWSPFQEAIFGFAEGGSGSARIDAVAGSGKTTTGVEAIGRLRGERIFLAFNKRIADELAKRRVPARTFHSLCFGPVRGAMGGADVAPQKIHQLLRDMLGSRARQQYGDWCRRLVGLAKNFGLGAITPGDEDEWLALIEHYDLPFREIRKDGEVIFDPGRALTIAQDLLTASNEDRARVDFDDMLYLAIRDDLQLPTFDVVFVDEAQDTNAIQREVLRRILRPGGRLVAIGDPHQAIYGFRGADSDAMDLIAADFTCEFLPLSICYRCGSSIVEYAQRWVPEILPAPGAPDGSVEVLGDEWDYSDFEPGDLIVCRVNAPLFALAMRLLRLRIAAHMHGRDVGDGLKSLIRRTDTDSAADMLKALHALTREEAQAAIERDQTAKAESAWDRYWAVNALSEGSRTVEEVLATIDELFRDKANAVQLASIHKAKGLEYDTVWWLRPDLPWIQKLSGWQLQQERNLCYVAVTRAKERLAIITPRGATSGGPSH